MADNRPGFTEGAVALAFDLDESDPCGYSGGGGGDALRRAPTAFR